MREGGRLPGRGWGKGEAGEGAQERGATEDPGEGGRERESRSPSERTGFCLCGLTGLRNISVLESVARRAQSWLLS